MLRVRLVSLTVELNEPRYCSSHTILCTYIILQLFSHNSVLYLPAKDPRIPRAVATIRIFRSIYV